MSPEVHQPGDPGSSDSVPLSVPVVGEAERRYVLEALDSGFVSSVGPFVSEFERRFADYVGVRHAVACSSGTAAIHVALRLLGVGHGAEVFCSDFTFIGSANPIAYQGADVVLVDAEPSTWNLDPSLLAHEFERRTAAGEPLPAAVEAVHVLGHPADMVAITEICSRFGVPVFEDAAESLGARWSEGSLAGRHTGTVSTVGCFSFNGNKIATTGGGGMIVTDDDDLAQRARHLTTQAKIPDVGYLHDEVGYNYRLTNLAAALGLAQLEQLDEFLAAKARIAKRYDAAFADLPVILPPRAPGTLPTFWLYSLLTESQGRDELLDHLKAAGIGARALWRPLHQQPPFIHSRLLGGSVGVDLFARGVSLPCSVTLTDRDQERVIEAVHAFFD